MQTIKIKMNKGCAGLKPIKAHDDDAAYDIKSEVTEVILPGQNKIVPAGFCVELPREEDYIWEIQIRPRSGLAAKSHITITNSPGTVDAGYRAVVGVILDNLSEDPFKVNRGDRIAQMVITKIPKTTLEFVEELSDSDRGQNGFGSTGVK